MGHVLMVLDHPFPPDIRVENEIHTLVEAGYEVSILALGTDDRPRLETTNGYRIIRDRIPDRFVNIMRGTVGSLPLMRAYLSVRLRQLFRQFPFDAIHAHDLYLFGVCISVGNTVNVPVVGDMHENWPDVLGRYAWSTTFPRSLFVRHRHWKDLEKRWAGQVDRLIVTIDEMARRKEFRGLDRTRTVVVPNTIRTETFRSYPLDKKLYRSLDAPLTMVYAGGMTPIRDLHTVVRAIPRIIGQIPRLQLVLVGDGSVLPDLRSLIDELHLKNNVRLEGWKPQSTIRTYLLAADIGLVSLSKVLQNDNAIAHKLFQYMYMGLPVVASNCGPQERILNEADAGLIYTAGSVDSFAAAVLELARDERLRRRLGHNGHRAVMERYNWDATAAPLLKVYQDLLGSVPQR